MIPKKIHYCWFGGNPLPKSAQQCIASWRKYLPDYEIKEWNESNFDVNIIPYTAEAYRMKKYAFVSDYARFWILYKYGGLYFDTDVEVIAPMDDIIERGNFMGQEKIKLSWQLEEVPATNPGLGLGVAPGLGLIAELLSFYQNHHYISWTGFHKSTETIVEITTRILENHSSKNIGNGITEYKDLYVYSPEYFCPKDYSTGELRITSNTKSIHHYAATWLSKETICQKITRRLKGVLVRIALLFS